MQTKKNPFLQRRFHELQLQDALRHRENERQHRELLDLLPARLQQRMVEEAEKARAERKQVTLEHKPRHFCRPKNNF